VALCYKRASCVQGGVSVLGKELATKKEEDNGYDRYAVSIMMNVDLELASA